MKYLWALPALSHHFKFALASHHTFSVSDDLLAFPQYEVVISDSFVTEAFAEKRLAEARNRSSKRSGSSTSHSTAKQAAAPEAASGQSGEVSQVVVATQNDGGASGQTSDNSKAGDNALENTYEDMRLNGSRFLCRIPLTDDIDPLDYTAGQDTTSSAAGVVNATEKARAAAEEAMELARATDRGWELLKGMQGNCIYFVHGWWSYSFCYNDVVTQFHPLPPGHGVPRYPPAPDPIVPTFVLGTFPGGGKKGRKELEDGNRVDAPMVDDEGVELDAGGQKGGKEVDGAGAGTGTGVDRAANKQETGLARLETRGETRYLVQKLKDGTMCDLTGRPRTIEVQFHCHPSSNDRIGMIKEVSTCSYLMVIYTPRLCNDIAFEPAAPHEPHKIACQHVLAESEIPAYNAAKLLEAARAEEEQQQQQAAAAAAKSDADKKAKEKSAAGDTPDNNNENNAAAQAPLVAPDGNKNPWDTSHHPRRAHDSSSLPTIGGIPVGARALVGDTPERKISPSIVAGGVVIVATVASSEAGTHMNERKMRELGVMDPAAVRQVIENLAREAKEKGRGKWELVMVDTDRGRQLQAVFPEEGKKKGGKGGKEEEGEGESEGEGKEKEKDGEKGSEEKYKD